MVMATQRIIIAKIAGDAGDTIAAAFSRWAPRRPAGQEAEEVRREVDRLGAQLRLNGVALPVIYYCEWIDRWSMGDLLPRSCVVRGAQVEAFCLLPAEAQALAAECPNQFQEQEWFAARLREAALAWEGFVTRSVLVVLREVLDRSTYDDELLACMDQVPGWVVECTGDP